MSTKTTSEINEQPVSPSTTEKSEDSDDGRLASTSAHDPNETIRVADSTSEDGMLGNVPVEDGRAAVRYLVANAPRLQLDVHRIAAFGGSEHHT